MYAQLLWILFIIAISGTTLHAEWKTCDKECKKKVLIELWVKKYLADPIVENCKKIAKDPVHCIKKLSSIAIAESGWWENCINKNCIGLGWWKFHYKTYSEWINDWITRYNKYWYKTGKMSDFYPPKGWKSKTRYCTSEVSSNSSLGCPNWLKHSSDFHAKLDKRF